MHEFFEDISRQNKQDYMNNFVQIEETYHLGDWLESLGFFSAPAATSHHGAYAGGLYEHSKFVALYLQELTDKRVCERWQDDLSPLKIGLLHDICKVADYRMAVNSAGVCKIEFVKDKLWKGHGEASIMILGDMPLTEEERACIRYHMGAFVDKEEWSYYSRAVHDYPNALWTHSADMYVSQVLGI